MKSAGMGVLSSQITGELRNRDMVDSSAARQFLSGNILIISRTHPSAFLYRQGIFKTTFAARLQLETRTSIRAMPIKKCRMGEHSATPDIHPVEIMPPIEVRWRCTGMVATYVGYPHQQKPKELRYGWHDLRPHRASTTLPEGGAPSSLLESASPLVGANLAWAIFLARTRCPGSWEEGVDLVIELVRPQPYRRDDIRC